MKKEKILLSLVVVSLICFPVVVGASSPVYQGLQDSALNTGLANNKDLLKFVGYIIDVVLSLLGVALVVILIYAGILWGFLAKNEPAQIKKAKEMIINAIIGLAIVFASYVITNYLFEQFNLAADMPTLTTLK